MSNKHEHQNQNRQPQTVIETGTDTEISAPPIPPNSGEVLEAFDATGIAEERQLFQSESAKEAVMKAARVVEEEAPKPAALNTTPSTPPSAPKRDPNKMVMIRSRKTIERTSIGGVWYQFIEGKQQLVPQHVANLLAEKGVI